MPGRNEIAGSLDHAHSYFTETLLPFWIERAPDPSHGGFLTYFDRHGRATGETEKTYLMQIRMLYTMASAHRAGYGGGRCADLARMGADFLLKNYWDHDYGGWFWVADRDGTPTVTDKIGYGQCFGLYAMSEYFLATGDQRGREAADATYASICTNMADTRHGGFYELMQRDWTPEASGPAGGDRKSLDVHMHLMEALTTYYEMTRHPTHRRRLNEIIDLILTKMLRKDSGTGYMQFALDFTPLPAIIFNQRWGRDAAPEDGIARPLDLTSYGHNVELAWLLLHAADILGQDRKVFAEVVRKICDHALKFGIDWDLGGVYVEGPDEHPPRSLEKQFWQQAEIMVGMLDAYSLFRDEIYWKAFRNVFDFVFEKFVAPGGGGEWYERLARDGTPIDDSLAHGWKISYHTVRSMIQVISRLKSLSSA